jgi:hypothetical protein
MHKARGLRCPEFKFLYHYSHTDSTLKIRVRMNFGLACVSVRIPLISNACSGPFRTLIPFHFERASERSDAGSFLYLEGVRFAPGSVGGFRARSESFQDDVSFSPCFALSPSF